MSIKYIKSFDGLRGIAALMILLYHWPYKYLSISHGWEFMQMFFVMSGYLITLTLIEEKKKYNFKKFAIRFYFKRALRLFPLYFGYLFGALLVFYLTSEVFNFKEPFAADVKKHGIYLFTYSFNWMNIINFFNGIDYSSATWSTHLWTLSIEEQFYLVFPFFVYLLSNKNLKVAIIVSIILAFFFRIFIYEWGKSINPGDEMWIAQNIVRIPFSQMDSFAFGALVAMFPLKFIKNKLKWLVALTVLLVLIYISNMAYTYLVQGESYYDLTFGKKFAEAWMTHNYLFVYMITIVNAWCAMVMHYVKSKESTPFLEFKPLMFLGRLSYGFYLLHLPIMHVFIFYVSKYWHFKTVNQNIFLNLTLLIIYVILMIFISHLVHKYFESYFMKFKNKLYPK